MYVVIISATSPETLDGIVVIFLTNITYILKRRRKTSALVETNEFFLSIDPTLPNMKGILIRHIGRMCNIILDIVYFLCVLLWALFTSSITKSKAKATAAKASFAFFFYVFIDFRFRLMNILSGCGFSWLLLESYAESIWTEIVGRYGR